MKMGMVSGFVLETQPLENNTVVILVDGNCLWPDRIEPNSKGDANADADISQYSINQLL